MATIDVIIKMLTDYYKSFEDENIRYYLKKPTSPNELWNIDEFKAYFEKENFGSNIEIIEDTEQMIGADLEALNNSFTNEYRFCGPRMNANYLKDTIDNPDYYALLKFQTMADGTTILHSAITFGLLNSTIMFIFAICVNKPKHVTGGGILINRLLDICIITSIETIVLEALTGDSENSGDSVNFYKKFGFEEIFDETNNDAGIVRMSNTNIMRHIESRQHGGYSQQYFEILRNILERELLEKAPKINVNKVNEDKELENLARLKNDIINEIKKIKKPRQYDNYKVKGGNKYHKKSRKSNKSKKHKKTNKRRKPKKFL